MMCALCAVEGRVPNSPSAMRDTMITMPLRPSSCSHAAFTCSYRHPEGPAHDPRGAFPTPARTCYAVSTERDGLCVRALVCAGRWEGRAGNCIAASLSAVACEAGAFPADRSVAAALPT